MSGDNLLGDQPDIRYSVDVRHHEEWEKMTLDEKMKIMTKAITNWESDYLKDNKKPTPKKMTKNQKRKKTPKLKGNGKKKAKQGPMGAPLFDGKAAGGGRTILSNEQWHGLITTGISESMDANMKNQEEKRSKWRKVANEAGLEVKQAIAAWKKLQHLGRQ